MKTRIFLLILLVAFATPALAQQRLRYTLWADGLVNPTSLYLLGAGARGEVSRPLRNGGNALFAQIGYGRFFQKATSAFAANTALLNVGYRYQSRRAFTASVGVGAQYWNEQMRVRFAEGVVAETFNNLIPSTTAGFGVRVGPRYQFGLEYRGLFKPEAGAVRLRNNVALSVGYTL